MKDAQEFAEQIEEGTRSFVSDVRRNSAQSDLFRSTEDAYIAGVCGGIAERFNIDATLVRLIFLLLLFSGSVGFWLYILLWVFLPTEAEIAGELDASLDDVPPMPMSGPYVDVPGMDSMSPKAPKAEPPSAPPAPDSGEAPTVHSAGDEPANMDGETPTNAEHDQHFPKPDTML